MFTATTLPHPHPGPLGAAPRGTQTRLQGPWSALPLCPGAEHVTSRTLSPHPRSGGAVCCLDSELGKGTRATGGSGASSRCRGQDGALSSPGQKDNRPGDKFQLTFPLRTNYMYAKVKKSLPEMYAFSVCMWLRSSAAPGVGTPFSYAVPGQANELVLIEWGNNPMEILINDKVGRCPAGRGPLAPGPGRLLAQVVTLPAGPSLPPLPHPPSALALPLRVEDHRCSGGAQVPLEVLPKSDLLRSPPPLGGGRSPGQAAFFLGEPIPSALR